MTAPRYTHVIWDWNGTLLDDAWLSVYTVNRLLEEDGLPPISQDRYAELFGWPLLEYYQALGFRSVAERWEEFCERFYSHYRPRERECRLREGAHELLHDLRSRGLTQSILSAYEHDPLNRLIDDLDMRHLFESVLGLETNVDFGKVERGREWLASTRLRPDEVLFVGDTLHDIEVAEALGVECVLVASGHQTATRLRRGAPGARVIEQLRQLDVLLGPAGA